MGLLLLVRHGQASFGADDYDVLSPIGWEQGRLLGRHLAELAPSVLLRGSMRRHRETLDAAIEAAGWQSEIVEDDRWDEFDHLAVVAAYPDLPTGQLDRRAFQAAFEQATGRWSAGAHDDDYAESFAAFRERTLAAMTEAAGRAGSGETVVVVTSGGVVAALCAALIGIDEASYAAAWQRFNTVCVNSGVTRVVVGSTGPRLLTFNEHGHLGPEVLTYR